MDSFKAMGLKQGFVDQLNSASSPQLRSLTAMAADLMREICRANDASWFIQGDQVNLLKSGARSPATPTSSNAQHRHVGLPEQTIEGVIVKVLLTTHYPAARSCSTIPASSRRVQPVHRQSGQNTLYVADGRSPSPQTAPTRSGASSTRATPRRQFYTTLTCTAKEHGARAVELIVDVPSEVDQVGGQ